jgi:hypothetical protein
MLNCLQNQMTAKITHNHLNYNDLFISLENPEVKSQPTGVSTFAIRTIQRTDQKLQKNFQITDPKEDNIQSQKILK